MPIISLTTQHLVLLKMKFNKRQITVFLQIFISKAFNDPDFLLIDIINLAVLSKDLNRIFINIWNQNYNKFTQYKKYMDGELINIIKNHKSNGYLLSNLLNIIEIDRILNFSLKEKNQIIYQTIDEVFYKKNFSDFVKTKYECLIENFDIYGNFFIINSYDIDSCFIKLILKIYNIINLCVGKKYNIEIYDLDNDNNVNYYCKKYDDILNLFKKRIQKNIEKGYSGVSINIYDQDNELKTLLLLFNFYYYNLEYELNKFSIKLSTFKERIDEILRMYN